MNNTLGPCPMCGGEGQASHANTAHMPLGWCLDQKGCGFTCSLQHWNHMRRKMTREEADALMPEQTSRMNGCKLILPGNTRKTVKCNGQCGRCMETRIIRAALTGEKS